jgi:hypothetical protein
MTKIGLVLAAWLKTGPGSFQGNTPDHAIAAAYLQWPGQKNFTPQEFKDHLATVGYEPVMRHSYGDGGGAEYWLLNLPETFGVTSR